MRARFADLTPSLLRALVLCASFAPAPVRAVPSCDASQCVPNPWVGVGWQAGGVTDGFYKNGQVFRPRVSSALREVHLGLHSQGPHAAVAEIRTVVNGLPTSTILGSVSIPGAPYTDTRFHVADFSAQQIMLDAGASDALVIRSSGPGVVTVLARFPACAAATTGSLRSVHTYDFGATWQALTDRSVAHRVCVDAVVPTEQSTWGALKLKYE